MPLPAPETSFGLKVTLTPLVETAHFRQFGGGTDNATYLTTALQFDWGDWSFVAMRTDVVLYPKLEPPDSAQL